MKKIYLSIIILSFILIISLQIVIADDCYGCLYNNNCYSVGSKIIFNNVLSYCSVDKQIIAKKADGSSCDNNFECINNLCSYSKCVSIYNAVKNNSNIINKIANENIVLDNVTISLDTLKDSYSTGDEINLTDPPDISQGTENIVSDLNSYTNLQKTKFNGINLTDSQIKELDRLNRIKLNETKKLNQLKESNNNIKIQGINIINPVAYIQKITAGISVNSQESVVKSSESNLNYTLIKYNVPTELQAELDAINDKTTSWIASYNSIIIKSEDYQIKISSGLIPPNVSSTNSTITSSIDSLDSSVESGTSLPDSFDWRNVSGKNYITSVKDQGQCGSCWAFATVGALEAGANAYNNNLINLNLSEQDLVSCDYLDYGCGGGWPTNTLYYIQSSKITNETCFPYSSGYRGVTGSCSLKCSNWKQGAWNVSSYTQIPLDKNIFDDENLIKTALTQNGPVITAFDVYNDFFSYTGGIYQHITGGFAGEHAVLIVGYGKYDGRDYWIVKNSWGTGWGENGYFRIFAGDSRIDSFGAWSINKPISPNPINKICEDKDNDGYCNWGLGSKPAIGCSASCNSNTIEDCDDTNSSIYQGCGKSTQNTGTLNLTTNPSNTNVYIKDTSGNFVYRGDTPISIELNSGNRVLELVKSGYLINITNVNIIDNQINNYDITLQLDSRLKQISYGNYSYTPAISGNNIVWLDERSFSQNIYVYNLITNQEKRLTYNYDNAYNPDIDGNKVVYIGVKNSKKGVYVYDLTTNQEIQVNNKSIDPSDPVISGDKIVWGDYLTNGNYDIYLYDLTKNQEIRVTNDTNDSVSPDIDGNKIVWSDSRNEGGNLDIFMCDLTGNNGNITNWCNTYQSKGGGLRSITYKTYGDQGAVKISGDKIVWEDWRNKNYDIYMYDLTKNQEIQITNNPFDQLSPSISNNIITWQDYRNNNWDIYMYNLTSNKEEGLIIYTGNQIQATVDNNKIVYNDNYNIYLLDLSRNIIASPQSKIVNNNNNALSGHLLMTLQKKDVNGYWQDIQNVVDKQITIPANSLWKLDKEWNPNNVIVSSSGDYRVYSRFESGNKFVENSTEFNVNGGNPSITCNSPSDCTTKLSQNNVNVVLSNDIQGKVTFVGNNSVFDCNGKAITGNENNNNGGIEISSISSTIKNCIISKFKSSDNSDITFGSGINILQNAKNNILTNNILFNNNVGVFIDYRAGTNNLIINNTIFSNIVKPYVIGSEAGEGIWCTMCIGNFIVKNNNIYGNGYNGVFLHNSGGILVQDNYIHDNLYNGIEIQSKGNNTIIGNKIYNNSLYGLHMLLPTHPDQGNNSVINNVISNSAIGFYVQQGAVNPGTPSNLIKGNDFRNNIQKDVKCTSDANGGIYIWDSNLCKTKDNTCVNDFSCSG